MHVEKRTLVVTTIADGSATAFIDGANGLLDRMQYVKAQSGSYSDGVDFTITLEDTGETIWTQSDVNSSAVVAPRQATHTTVGAAALYAAAGVAVLDRIAVSGRIKIVLAAGGNVTTGTFVATFI